MIDTDKYEGHTRGPWSIKTGNASHSVKDANGDHVCTIPDPIGMCNKHIIADAPLLLAEVKRLKIYERLVLCIAYHQQLPDGLYVDEELMLRAREHLRKNGEWEDEEE